LKAAQSNLEEKELITLCKNNDARAQEKLYDLYAIQMFRVCYRYVNSETEAEDIMIKGFVKVFQKIQTFEYRGQGSLKGWIKRIMINESLMVLRKTQLDTNPISEQAYQVASPAELDEHLIAEDIYKIVKNLPNGYRTVFNLFAIEGYSHKEISDLLNISINTSKSQLSKARALLKKTLTIKGYGE